MPMTDAEITDLRRRIRNQRRELRKLNKHIAQLNLWLQLANARHTHASHLYQEARSKRYRTRAYHLYIWWRNRVVWRVGQLLPGARQQWDARHWYETGVNDTCRVLGVPSGRKFP